MKNSLLLVLSLITTLGCYAQKKIPAQEFKELLSHPRIPYFDEDRKKYFGCGMQLDCIGMKILYKEVILDKKNKKIKISGYVNPITDNNDTTATTDFRIFIGRVKGDDMHVFKTLLQVSGDTIKIKDARSSLRIKESFFTTEFTFTKDDHFFIESDDDLYRIVDYDIGSLLK